MPEEKSESAFREMYPTPNFRVSCGVYESGTSFSGITQSGLVVSLNGKFEFRFSNELYVIQHNEYWQMPEGSYDFRVLGDIEAKVLLVWNIREIMKKTKDFKRE